MTHGERVLLMQGRRKSGFRPPAQLPSRGPVFKFKPERREFVKETAEAVSKLLD